MTAVAGLCCLLAVNALALDPGDGTTISAQQLRLPVGAESGKTLLLDDGQTKLAGEKAALSVYQVYTMYFGTLCDNDGVVVLGDNDKIIQDADHLVYGGSPQSGVIRLYGDAFHAVSIDITPGSATGFQISEFDTDYGIPPLSGLTLDATGYLTLRLGARLQLYSSSVSSGSGQQIGYTVEAVYE